MDLKSEKAKSLSKQEVLDLLKAYITDQVELSRRKCIDEENFSLPSWAEYQAYQLGFQKAFLKLQSLLPDKGESNV
jgi:hypothetical protein